MTTHHHLIAADLVVGAPRFTRDHDELHRALDGGAVRPQRQRKQTLISIARQAARAAISVARYEVKPDGTIIIHTGETADEQPGNALDRWLETRREN